MEAADAGGAVKGQVVADERFPVAPDRSLAVGAAATTGLENVDGFQVHAGRWGGGAGVQDFTAGIQCFRQGFPLDQKTAGRLGVAMVPAGHFGEPLINRFGNVADGQRLAHVTTLSPCWHW